jgi:hypothetical protein
MSNIDDDSCIAIPKNCGSEVGRGERQELETVSQDCAGMHKGHKRRGELCICSGMLRESCTRNGAIRDMCMMTMRRSILEDSYSRFRSCRNISSIIISHERE